MQRVKAVQMTLSGATERLAVALGESTGSVAVRSLVGNADAYIGDSTVTSSTGFLLGAGEVLSFTGIEAESLYIRGTATNVVHIIATAQAGKA